MKNFKFLAALFVSGLVLCTTSCSDETKDSPAPTPPPVKISLSVAGGGSATVDGADVTKSVTITASAKSENDIVVTLKDDAAAGQVAFPVNPVTIKAGTTSVSADVTFTLEGFPAGTAEKNVGITIKSSTENVTIGTATTTFAVKGKDGVELAPVVVTTNATEFNTTDAAQEATITFTLAKALNADLAVALAYANDSELKSVTLPEVKIAKGQTTTTATLTVAKGMAGVMKLTLTSESARLDKEALTFTFKKDDAPVASIEAKDGTTVTVPNDANVVKAFTISLDKKPTKEVTVNLALTGNENGGAQLNASEVKFTTNDQSKEVTVTFKKDVFNASTVTANVVVTATAANSDLTVNEAKKAITYAVAGTTVGKPNVSISTNGTSVTVPNGANVTKTITATLSSTATKDVVVNLALTGNEKAGAELLANSITIRNGETTGTTDITFKKDVFNAEAVTASIVVSATAADATVVGSQITYSVKGTTVVDPGQAQQLGLKFLTEGTASFPGDYTRMDLPYNNNNDGKPAGRYDFWIQVQRAPSTTQVGNVKVRVDIEGFSADEYNCTDIDADGYYTLAPDKTGWAFSISFNNAKGKGKSGRMVFTSTEATIDSGIITVTAQ